MKSDREFLDGIYAKAEELTLSKFDNLPSKKSKFFHSTPARYIKYAGIAAVFILLLSSAMFIPDLIKENNQVDITPIPRNVRYLPPYTEQIMEQASDIVEIKAYDSNDEMTLVITRYYKKSEIGSLDLSYLDSSKIGLAAGETAIVFLNVESKEAPVMDIFTLDSESNCFINPYGESITEELLDRLNVE